MKKLIYLIVLALILGLVLTGCLLSNVGQVPTTEQSGITYLTKHTADDPQETRLFAGQDILVGTVYVWNDCVNLYVKYETTGGWVMTETHLAVVAAPGDFPTTNKGNPKVGHFPYGEENIFTDTWEEIIELSAIPAGAEQKLFIAAHAVVLNETTTELGDNLVANGGFELPTLVGTHSIFATGTSGLEWTVEPTIPPWDSDSPGSTQKEGLELQRIWTPHSGVQYAELDAYDPVRIYQNLLTTSLKGSYTLTYAWSPRPRVLENKIEVFWDGSKIAEHSADGSSNSNTVWTVETHTGLVPNESGTSRLEFVETGLHDQLGMFLDSVSVVQEDTESAWAEGLRFTKKGNWATYFNYTVQPVLVDTVYVYADNTSTIYSNVTLESGKNYQLKASGIANAGDTIDFDAKYSITNRIVDDEWTDLVSGYEGYGTGLLELKVNGEFVSWGDFNSEHIYYWNIVGDGSPLGVALWIYDIYYPNNSGFLTVDIYCMP